MSEDAIAPFDPENVQGPRRGRTGTLRAKRNQWEMEQKRKMSDMFLDPSISYADCIRASLDSDKQNHRLSRINHKIHCFRNDGIYQLNRAIESVFGAVASVDDNNPSKDGTVNMVDIQLADGTRTKAPYGEISLASLGEDSSININYDDNTHDLIVTGKCQQMYMPIMDDIIEQTEKNIAANSIYKSQALEITDINNPKIIDLSSIDDQLMVLSKDVEYGLRPIIARLEQPQKCIKRGIPLKYGALLEGSYGTGKTLLAFKLARIAVKNNWIFIYLKDPTLLAEVLRMSKIIDRSGNGALVFLEDIDQVTRGNRDAAMQDILNTLDGGDTKNMNVISLFTTNHIEVIEPTFLRGKRIGTIISMGFLDADTTKRFLEESFKIGGYKITEDITNECQLVAESSIAPAFMAEIVEAIKARLVFDDRQEVTAQDIRYAITSYLHQVELSKIKPISASPAEQIADNLKKVLKVDEMQKAIADIQEQLED